jgi:hypothetical protein
MFLSNYENNPEFDSRFCDQSCYRWELPPGTRIFRRSEGSEWLNNQSLTALDPSFPAYHGTILAYPNLTSTHSWHRRSAAARAGFVELGPRMH